MSRLDSFIRRMIAQRACLDRAGELVRDLPGPVLELGLGNGRTYDHLREILPGREIYVFERQVAAHPDCIPADGFLILGDARETLRACVDRFRHRAALAHIDMGTGERAANRRLARELAPLLAPLMKADAVVVSEPPIELPGWRALPLPPDISESRYHIYQVE